MAASVLRFAYDADNCRWKSEVFTGNAAVEVYFPRKVSEITSANFLTADDYAKAVAMYSPYQGIGNVTVTRYIDNTTTDIPYISKMGDMKTSFDVSAIAECNYYVTTVIPPAMCKFYQE